MFSLPFSMFVNILVADSCCNIFEASLYDIWVCLELNVWIRVRACRETCALNSSILTAEDIVPNSRTVVSRSTKMAHMWCIWIYVGMDIVSISWNLQNQRAVEIQKLDGTSFGTMQCRSYSKHAFLQLFLNNCKQDRAFLFQTSLQLRSYGSFSFKFLGNLIGSYYQQPSWLTKNSLEPNQY